MKNALRAAVLAVLATCALAAPAAAQDNFAVKDGTGATITKSSKKLTDGSQADKNVMIDGSGIEKGTSANPWYIQFPTVPTVTIANFPSTQAVTGTFWQSTQPVSAAALPLPAGAATAANQGTAISSLATIATNTTGLATASNQSTANGSLAAIATNTTGAATAARQDALLTALGTPAQAGGKVDTVIAATAADRGALVGTTAVTLMASNTGRRGFSVQNQSASASCYINGQGAATTDYHSLLVGPGQLYETPPTHVGTGAISAICSAAGTSLYAREF